MAFNFNSGTNSTPAFGSGGFSAFGASTPASSPAFGAAPTTFGTSSTGGGFNFGGLGGASSAAAAAPAFGQSAASTPGFGSFGNSAGAASTPSFGFGAPQQSSNAPTPSFGLQQSASGFGQAASQAKSAPAFGVTPSTGFGFGQPQTAASSAAGFGFGQTQPAASSAAAFGFGQSQAAASNAPSFGLPQSQAASSSFGLGQQPSATPAASTPPTFGQTQSAATTSSFGQAAPQSAPGFGLGTTPASTASSNALPSISTAPQSSPGFPNLFGTPAASGTSAPAFGLSSSPATSTSAAASALPFSFPASNASTPASSSAFPLAVSTPLPSTSTAAGFSFGSAAATSAPLGFGASSAAASAASASSSLTLAAGSAASAGPASGPATSAAGASSQPAADQPLSAPSEIKGKNVKSIIDDWTKELQSHSRAFVEDAQKLAAWDEHIRLKRRELLEMEAHLEQVRKGQDAVHQKLQMLETHQKETHDSLTAMERVATSMYKDEKNLMSDEDADRDALYERAEQVSKDLSHMALDLRDCIDNVNARSLASQANASDPLSKIVRILNNQLQALTHVDESAEQVAKKLEEVTGRPISATGFSQLDT